MSTLPPDAPPEAPHDGPYDGPHDGPRVTRDDVRDLARLRRSRRDRKIGGVAAGLARHLDVDPLITRVLLVVLVFFGGAGLLLYAAGWLLMPVDDSGEAVVRLDDRSRAVALAVVGAVAGLALVGDTLGGWGLPWPVFALAAVVLVVLMVRGGEPRLHPFEKQSWVTPPPTGRPAPVDLTKASASGWVPPVSRPAPPVRSSRRRGPVLFWYALAVIALGCGVLGVVDTAGADVAGSAYPALALGTCAALLVLGAFWGRAGGLILLGLVAALATAGASVADKVEAGRIEAAPTTAASVQDRYDLAFGEIQLDLTDVGDVDGLDGRRVEVELDFAGRIEVLVPAGVSVDVTTTIEEGDVRVFGDRLGDSEQRTLVDGGTDAPELTLDVALVFGEIEIVQEAR